MFISYSSQDAEVAERVVASLEARGLRCWIAPRDVAPGVPYGEALVDAIEVYPDRFLVSGVFGGVICPTGPSRPS